MAKELRLVDDIDGTEADRTITFTIEGVRYEMDLSKKNQAAFLKDLKPWVDAARKIGGKPKRKIMDTAAIRAWAIENGFEVSDRGRIPDAVIDEYKAR